MITFYKYLRVIHDTQDRLVFDTNHRWNSDPGVDAALSQFGEPPKTAQVQQINVTVLTAILQTFELKMYWSSFTNFGMIRIQNQKNRVLPLLLLYSQFYEPSSFRGVITVVKSMERPSCV